MFRHRCSYCATHNSNLLETLPPPHCMHVQTGKAPPPSHCTTTPGPSLQLHCLLRLRTDPPYCTASYKSQGFYADSTCTCLSNWPPVLVSFSNCRKFQVFVQPRKRLWIQGQLFSSNNPSICILWQVLFDECLTLNTNGKTSVISHWSKNLEDTKLGFGTATASSGDSVWLASVETILPHRNWLSKGQNSFTQRIWRQFALQEVFLTQQKDVSRRRFHKS